MHQRRSPRSTRPRSTRQNFTNSSRNRGGRPHTPKRRSRAAQPSFNPAQFINKNPRPATPDTYEATHAFSDWPLHAKIQSNLASHGLTTPTQIQDQIIPEILAKRDVVGIAQTGTGKTAAFLVPLLQRAIDEPNRATLILTPTRELAIQIEAEAKQLARGLTVHTTTCVGGLPIGPQIRSLHRKNHFVIGTPGRIQDLINRGELQMECITTVVLDEADRMLDMGFIHDMRAILRNTKDDRHTLFFSATMTSAATTLTHEFLHKPVTISARTQDVTASVAQDVVPFLTNTKFDTLATLLAAPAYTRVIVFGAMKRGVETLTKELQQVGIKAESIHGDKSHRQRQRSLERFKDGRANVLVATDVAARGIHVDNVSHVINYDLPNTFEDYVHRIGRTGRGSKHGQALTFIPHNSTTPNDS
jgi:superfamily II DNA/RNA helicase